MFEVFQNGPDGVPIRDGFQGGAERWFDTITPVNTKSIQATASKIMSKCVLNLVLLVTLTSISLSTLASGSLRCGTKLVERGMTKQT